MGRTCYIAVLDLISCFCSMDINRDIITQKNLFFFPVDLIADIDPVQFRIEVQILYNGGIQIFTFYTDTAAYRPVLCYCDALYIIYRPGFLCIIIVDIPCIVVMRTVFIAHDHVGAFALRKDLSLLDLVIDTAELSFFI